MKSFLRAILNIVMRFLEIFLIQDDFEFAEAPIKTL